MDQDDVKAKAQRVAEEWQAYIDDRSALVPHPDFFDTLTDLLKACGVEVPDDD